MGRYLVSVLVVEERASTWIWMVDDRVRSIRSAVGIGVVFMVVVLSSWWWWWWLLLLLLLLGSEIIDDVLYMYFEVFWLDVYEVCFFLFFCVVIFM